MSDRPGWQIIDPRQPIGHRHQRIMASAGSGKTYALSSRYLALVLRGSHPGSILATTFTRKAAGEIRDRVLRRLADAVDHEADRARLAASIGVASLERDDVLRALREIVRRVHLMRIVTIDAFFASVVHTHALELGIEPGSEIIDEATDNRLKREALRLMLRETDAQALITALRALTQGNADRAIARRISEVANDLQDIYNEAPEGAWHWLQPSRRLPASEIVDAIEELRNTPPLQMSTVAVKAHQADVDAAMARDWTTFLKKGLTKGVLGGGTYRRQQIDAATQSAYRAVIDIAATEIRRLAFNRLQAMRTLVQRFDTEYARLKRERGALTFADLTQAMRSARGAIGTMDDICLRLDGQINHLLLDEFQDTSTAQWQSLAPIARMFVEDETRDRSLFCVGDVKQSIYYWRGGCPDILEQLPQLLLGSSSDHITQSELAKSYRSSPVIIEGVNAVFGDLSRSPALDGRSTVAAAWDAGYVQHTTAVDRPGFMRIAASPAPDDPADDDADQARRRRHEAAATFAAQVHTAAPTLTIGVLVWTNNDVMKMIHALDAKQLSAAGIGGRPLTDTTPVNILLDALTLADHPDDTAAAFHLAGTPVASDLFDFTEYRKPSARVDLSWRIRRELLAKGYGPTIGRWAAALKPHCSGWEQTRLAQFATLAAMFDRDATLRPGDFVEVVKDTPMPVPGGATISVMTIHQAKGLEFDVVLLPELEEQLGGRSLKATVVIDRAVPGAPITAVCPYLNSDERAVVTEAEGIIRAHGDRVVRETLCELYVAMTRARMALWGLVEPSNRPRKKVSGVITAALTPHPHQVVADEVIYERGDLDAVLATAKVAADQDETLRQRGPISFASVSPRLMITTAPSAHHDGEDAAMRVMMLPDREAQARGRAVHAMLEQINWLDEHGLPDEDTLVQSIRRAAPRSAAASTWVNARLADFRQMVGDPALQQLLSRRDRAVELHRELPYLRAADRGVQRGCIDRLEVHRDGDGAIRAARIIDFKTDQVAASAVDAAAARYRPQLQAYLDAVGSMYGLDRSAMTATVVFVGPRQVCDLDMKSTIPEVGLEPT